MKEANILKILESGEKDFEELKSELDIGERELKKELKNLARNGSIEKDNDSYKLKVKKTENKKNYLPFVLLALIVIFGFYLRIYHIDYPVVGYHNWKETHYLTEARNFARDGFFAKGFFVPMLDYPGIASDPSGAHSDTFPLTPILVALAFKVFGMKLWIARLVGILFNTGTIVMMYLIARKLFSREDIALSTALLTAFLPLLVFFSHNVELVNPALFFMVASIYFYLVWRDSFDDKYIILTSTFLTIAVLTKYIFLVAIAPMIIALPIRKLYQLKGHIPAITISFLMFLMVPTWIFYSDSIVTKETSTTEIISSSGIDFLRFLNSDWINMQKSYVSDNFTMIGFYVAVLSLIVLVISYIRRIFIYKQDDATQRFLIGYAIALLPFLSVLGSKLGGHSYYYYPIAPLVIFLIAYLIMGVGDFAKRINVEGNEVPHIGLFVSIIMSALLLFSMPESFNRQFDTQFPGLDIAGDYINKNKNPGERIIHSTHQAYGILWHGDIKGVGGGIPQSAEDIKTAEERLNAVWLFIYQWDFNLINDKGRWDYIKNHYSLRQIAFLRTDKGIQPIYFLLKRGGTFDESTINSMLQNKKVSQRDYEYTRGIQRVYYIDIEE